MQPLAIRLLGSHDVAAMRALLDLYADAFEDAASYDAARPHDAYLAGLLASDGFITLVAEHGDRVVGGLSAYVLRKFEQVRSEVYIYDLAVGAAFRRRGVAIGLIEALKPVARARGASVIFVQADREDGAAIALYETLGTRAEVLHFDIAVDAPAALTRRD